MTESWTTMRVTEHGYEPVEQADKDRHAKLKPGTLIGARLMRGRSWHQHRHYWAVINAAAHGMGYQPDSLHAALLVATGRINVFSTLTDGRLMVIPQHTNMATMTAAEFTAYTQEAFRLLEEKMGVSVEEILEYA